MCTVPNTILEEVAIYLIWTAAKNVNLCLISSNIYLIELNTLFKLPWKIIVPHLFQLTNE